MQSDPQSGPFLPVRELGNKYQQGKLTAGRQRIYWIVMTSEESGMVNSMIGTKLVRESRMANDKSIEMMLRIFCVQRCLKIQRIQIVDVKQK